MSKHENYIVQYNLNREHRSTVLSVCKASLKGFKTNICNREVFVSCIQILFAIVQTFLLTFL